MMKTKAIALICLTAVASVLVLVIFWQVQKPGTASAGSEAISSPGASVAGKSVPDLAALDPTRLDTPVAAQSETPTPASEREESQTPEEGEAPLLPEQLMTMALADGEGAVARLLEEPDEVIRRGLFPVLLDVWADVAPEDALVWFHDAAQDTLADDGYAPGPSFYAKTFRHLAGQHPERAAQSFPAVEGAEERLSALSGMVGMAEETGKLPELMDVLGPYAELRPVEVAFLSAVVGDEDSFSAIQSELSSAEQKMLGMFLLPDSVPEGADTQP